MTIELPEEVASSLAAAVEEGRFSSLDDALVEAARRLIVELDRTRRASKEGDLAMTRPDAIIGFMRDDCELMDEIVADAYRLRRLDAARDVDL